jgi:hypothetical protein
VTPNWSRFAAVAAVLVAVVLVVVAVTTPPDPYTQLRAAGPGVVVAVIVAYLAVVGSGE